MRKKMNNMGKGKERSLTSGAGSTVTERALGDSFLCESSNHSHLRETSAEIGIEMIVR